MFHGRLVSGIISSDLPVHNFFKVPDLSCIFHIPFLSQWGVSNRQGQFMIFVRYSSNLCGA